MTIVTQLIFLSALMIWLRSRDRAASGETLARISPGRKMVRMVAVATLIAALAVSVVLAAVSIGGDVLTTRLASLSSEVTASAQEAHAGVRRREIWTSTGKLIKSHPFVGSGFGGYPIAITEFHQASGEWIPEAAHNDYLELGAAGGIVGATLTILFVYVVFARIRHRLLQARSFHRACCVGALTGIFGVMAHSSVDFGIQVTANAVFFIALIVIATVRQDRLVENCQLNAVGGKPIKTKEEIDDFANS